MTLMMKLTVCSYHSQIHDLIKAKVTGVEPPTTLVASCLNSGLTVVPSLIPAVLPETQARPPPFIQR